MKCPWCDGLSVDVHSAEERQKDESMPDVSFIDLRFFCNNCKYMFNCVGAKSLNISK